MSTAGTINPVTKKRQRHPKKPYCLECKARRVKCDMTKPACIRCDRKKRPCHYDPFLSPGTDSDPRISQQPVLPMQNENSTSSYIPQENSRHTPMQLDLRRSSSTQLPPLPSPSMSEPRITIQNLSNNHEAAHQYLSPNSNHRTTDFLPGRLSSVIAPQIPISSSNGVYENIRTGSSYGGAQSTSDATLDTPPGWNSGGTPRGRSRSSRGESEMHPRNMEAIYTRAFFEQFLSSNIVVSQPERWRIVLKDYNYGPLLSNAIQLLGAWRLDRSEAQILYQHCLKMLAYSLQDWKADDPSSVETCVTSLLLASYELSADSTGGIDTFVQHLKGVGALLLAQVKVMVDMKPDDPRVILLRLASQTFCCMDLLYAPMLNHPPSVNADEFIALSTIGAAQSSEETEVIKAFQSMHQMASLTANTTETSPLDMAGAESMQKTLNSYVSSISWFGLKQTSAPESFIDLGIDISFSPFRQNFSYPGVTKEEALFRTMIALIYHTLQLNLILYMGCHSVSIQAIEDLCETIIGIVQHLCSRTKFLWWCLWSTWMVVRFYFRLSEQASAKLIFSLSLLESVVKILGVENLGVSYTDQLLLMRDRRDRGEATRVTDNATIHSLVAAIQESTYKTA